MSEMTQKQNHFLVWMSRGREGGGENDVGSLGPPVKKIETPMLPTKDLCGCLALSLSDKSSRSSPPSFLLSFLRSFIPMSSCSSSASNIVAPRRSARIATKAAPVAPVPVAALKAAPVAPIAAPVSVSALKAAPAAPAAFEVIHKDAPIPVPTRRSNRIDAANSRINQFKYAAKGLSYADRVAFINTCETSLERFESLGYKEKTVEREIERINLAADLMHFIGQNIQHVGFGPLYFVIIAKREELMNTKYNEKFLKNFWYKRAATRLYKTCYNLKASIDMALRVKMAYGL
jgi:hypothetical protein